MLIFLSSSAQDGSLFKLNILENKANNFSKGILKMWS